MSEMITVESLTREEFGKNASRRLRKAGSIPATLYGLKEEAVSLTVNPKVIYRILHSPSGQNTLFKLAVAGQNSPHVLIKDYQREPVKGSLMHVDFLRIDMSKKLHVQVPLEYAGTPIGVKTFGGIMDVVVRELEIECLPTDIPEHITVDVSELGINDLYRVGQIQVPENVKIITDPDVVLVTVLPQRAEEEAVAPAAEEGKEPEVIKKGKKEEEQGKV